MRPSTTPTPSNKRKTPEQLRIASAASSSTDRYPQDSRTSSRSRSILPETSESIPDASSDSTLARSSLSTITDSTRTVREITRDGDGNEYFFKDFSGEACGDDPPHRKDSHNTRIGEGDDSNAHLYSLSPQTGEGHVGAALNRKVARQIENDNNGAGLLSEGALLPLPGGHSEGGVEDADAEFSVPVLPSGWEAVVADDDGAVFYHHIASGATQWEVPQQQERYNTGTD